jgi:hypothetical protein
VTPAQRAGAVRSIIHRVPARTDTSRRGGLRQTHDRRPIGPSGSAGRGDAPVIGAAVESLRCSACTRTSSWRRRAACDARTSGWIGLRRRWVRCRHGARRSATPSTSRCTRSSRSRCSGDRSSSSSTTRRTPR